MIDWGIRPRVLVVEDSPELMALLRRVIAGDGYDCQPVTSGNDVFDACVDYRADVVLLDIGLPDRDGLSVCRDLKAAPETRLVPVLLMTGWADRDHYVRALEAGADDFLPKPIFIPELRARLRSAIRMKQYIDELDDASASIVMLGATIEARDRSTEGHCQRLSEYARRLGVAIGLGREDLRALERGAYLHDLGKIAVPDHVLFKSGPLTPAEFDLVKSHPVVGDRICSPLRTLARARPIVRWHHELLDGSGYPDGLRGSAIPLIAQVAAVADVYDAITTERPYRPALTPAVACEILRDEALRGRRDAALVSVFCELVSGDCRADIHPN